MSGKDTCEKIQQGANDLKKSAIEADINPGKLAADFFSSLNPLNTIKAVLTPKQNEVANTINNIMSNNISQTDVTNITNTCSNSMAMSQINSIANDRCPNCNGGVIYNADGTVFARDPKIEQIDCSATGNIQSNVANLSQDCAINSTISVLSKNTSDLSAQTLAKTLQESSGLFSGNNSAENNVCNQLDNNISSEQYLNSISTCSNTFSSSQKNILQNCGKMSNNVQKNNLASFQKCVIDAGATTEQTNELTTAVSAEIDDSQKSTGLSLDFGLGGIIGMIVVIIIILIMVAMWFFS